MRVGLPAAALLAAAGCLPVPAGPGPPTAATCAALTADLPALLAASWGSIRAASGIADTLLQLRLWVERQLVPHDEWVAFGWCEFRAERLAVAKAAFAEARQRVRHSADALVGLGYLALRDGDAGSAIGRFAGALGGSSRYRDAAEGLISALERAPDGQAEAGLALKATRQAADARPDDARLLYASVLASRKSGGSGELRRHPDAQPATPDYFARSGADYLELRQDDGSWRPLFVKGVNLGPARPGYFASESPEDEPTWRDWLERIAALGANSLRLYTLQPPAFYRALAAHNRERPEARLWLLQGVWADLPPGHDFADEGYLQDLKAEIARVVDAVHGDLVLAPKRGHARGVYDTDVSADTLAWIVGREWEPFAVVDFERTRPASCDYAGRYVAVVRGRPMECWIAGTLDFTAGYEARRFGQARPLSFANWPTLDPLTHPTEATRAEEDELRHRLEGIPVPRRSAPAWDDDAATIDAVALSATGDFPAGTFASYHVYPNFPYFMNLEPAYAEARDEQGVLRYAGYLRSLKAHHGRQPVLVAEFGMSTSRGIAHLQPEGLHHGGHDEAEAMRQNVRLLNAIHRERMAGGVAFEFMDEWFKGTWSTSPFELPEEHRPKWYNAESPEQSYGLFANRPRAPVRVDGDPADWADMAPLESGEAGQGGWTDIVGLHATQDAGWLYLLVETAGRGSPDWRRVNFELGIDTYAAERGERRLSGPAACEVPTGVEFVVRLAGPGASELKVTPSYRPRHPAESGALGPMVSPTEPSGRYVSLSLETNRERYTRDGRRIAPERVHPGLLRFGSLDPASPDFDTRSDVAVGPEQGVIELRLAWALLGFSDPSTHSVLHMPGRAAAAGSTVSEGVRIYVCATDPGTARDSVGLPPPAAVSARLSWNGWQHPESVFEPKHGLDVLRDAFRAIPDSPRPSEGAT